MDLTRIDTIVQFTQGTTIWNNVNTPVPAGAVVIDTVSKTVKEGDGTTLFANLPVCLDYNFQGSTSGASTLEGDDVGKIIIADDQMYKPGSVKLVDILNNITAKANLDTTQQTRITGLNTTSGIIAEVSEGTVDGTIVICQDGQYIPGDKTLAQLIADLVAQANVAETGMHIDDLEWYTDSGLTNKVVKPNQVTERNTYWCKITGFHDNAELRSVDFGLATTNPNVTITNSAKEITSALIVAVYGGTSDDQFRKCITDSQDNIICVGFTSSEGVGVGFDATVIKFDSSLNIVSRKRYGGTGEDRFTDVVIDSNDNIICAGYTASEGAGNYDALVVKFDSNLNIIARKRYGGTSSEIFYGIVVDHADNIICAGYTGSEGSGTADALVIKFDSSLNILARKRYGGANADQFIRVCVDSNNNIICVGDTYSEGTAGDGLIVKFDTNLNILTRKRYGGSGLEQLKQVVVDTSNNIYGIGYTESEGSGLADGLIIKFDSSLNILARKRYGNANNNVFNSATIDSNNNIICIGHTQPTTKHDGLIVKFDSSLNVIVSKICNGTNDDVFWGACVDSKNNVICCGWTENEGLGANDALVVKFPSNIPSGTITGTVLTNLTLTDAVGFTLADSTLTLADSALTLGESTLTLANSTLTLSTSTSTFERDIFVAGRYTDPTELITTVYSSTYADEFRATDIDSTGNIFAVGMTTISNNQNALICKFDSSFNVISRKLYTGQYADNFNSVVVDSSDNVIAIGKYLTMEGGFTEAFIVKFSNDLSTVVAHKTYGATGDDVFNDITVGPSGNYYVVGYTTSEGTGLKECLVVKFNSSLTILYKKRYGGTSNDVLNGVAMDANGNAICVGYTGSEGTNQSGLILKLDSNLNVVLRKYYNSTLGTSTEFSAVAVTAANVMFCVGKVVIASGNKGLIVKFDTSLNVTGNKVYGNTVGSTEFTGVDLDTDGYVVVAGKTNAEGAGNYDALIMRFSNTLAIVGRKTYGSIGEDANIDVSLNNDNDIILSGYSVIKGSTDAVVTKLPITLPTGVYTNKYLTDLILSESKLTLSDDNATVLSSSLAMADSALVLTNGTMTLQDANGAVTKDITIMDAISNIFKVQFGNTVGAEASVPVSFVVTTNDGDETLSKTISVDTVPFEMITATYGGTNDESFRSIVSDSLGNIICIGNTDSEGSGSHDILIVKFDSSLNIVARKRYGGINADGGIGVSVDSQNNIICCGNTNSEGSGGSDALIIKFDSNLNIIARKRYGGTLVEEFITVAVDSSDNIVCCGYTSSEGSGSMDALIVKFDSSLNIVARKRYGGTGEDEFHSVAIDSNNNIICVGYAFSESAGGSDALIVKFDSSLNLVSSKRYGGISDERFISVGIDSQNNVICCGRTLSEGQGGSTYGDALIIKFDSSLNMLARKIYGGAGNDFLNKIVVDSSDNIICSGITSSEGYGSYDALIVKFDSSLNLVSSKRYGGISNDYFQAITTDSNDNISCAGQTNSEGSGGIDALIIKLSNKLESGSFSGTILGQLVLTDTTTLNLSNSALTLTNANLTLADSTLTLANSTLTLADSALTLKREVITT